MEPALLPMRELPDSALVGLALGGDTEAADTILCRHWAAFSARASRACHDPEDAKDLCQDACIQALSRLGDLRDGNAFEAWVLARITSRARDQRKKTKNSGTNSVETSPYLVSAMIIERRVEFGGDVDRLLGLLAAEADRFE